MKRKTMNAVITKKFNEWSDSIDDEEVKKLVKKNTIITGGCIASMINNEKVNDYDVYFTNQETVLSVARYYIRKFTEKDNINGRKIMIITGMELNDPNSELGKEVAAHASLSDEDESKDKELLDFYEEHKGGDETGRVFIFIRSVGIVAEKEIDLDDCENPLDEDIENTEDKDKPKYRPIFFSSNAISLSDKIQIVVRFYGDAKQIHENFDFIHATNYWTSEKGTIELNLDAYEACHNKELIYVGSKYPVCSLFRMRKFIGRGYTITAGEILKIAMNINEFDLTKVKVLRDQLIGVDSAYFNNLIDAIKSKEQIDRMYITALVNKMFN
ncbi:MAG: hypothetical protein LBQ88_09785 [Treponema sp.]|jgi:hypothetical protein|nr:hypothetical protein [Treponema sp.]